MSDIWLTPMDIKQYFYCRAIPYLNHVMGIYESQKEYEREGKEAHEELSRLEARRKTLLKHIKLKGQKHFRIKLTSQRLALKGILDCLIINNREYIPIEYKTSKSHRGTIHDHHKYQLVAYALLVEDTYDTIVRKGYVYYQMDDKLLRQTVTNNMRRQVLKALESIRSMIITEQEPIIRPLPQKCRVCGYKRCCPWALM